MDIEIKEFYHELDIKDIKPCSVKAKHRMYKYDDDLSNRFFRYLAINSDFINSLNLDTCTKSELQAHCDKILVDFLNKSEKKRIEEYFSK